MTDVQALKFNAAKSILAQDTYSPESGLYQRLLAAMVSKLTLHELRDLDVLIALKGVERRQEGQQLEKMLQS